MFTTNLHMKIKILIIGVILSSFNISYAQFDTQYNESGDPLTEKIDMNMMKQGKWLYYDQYHTLIKVENYNENELTETTIVKSQNKIDVTDYSVIHLNNSELGTNLHGEVVFDENGIKIVSYFYLGNSGNNNLLLQIEEKLVSLNYRKNKTIFQF